MNPYADDWVKIGTNVEFNSRLKLYRCKDKTYDERSAQHNGIIGQGAQLKSLLKDK